MKNKINQLLVKVEKKIDLLNNLVCGALFFCFFSLSDSLSRLRTNSGVPIPRIPPSDPINIFSSVLLFLIDESTRIFGDDVLVVKNDFEEKLLGPFVTKPLVIPNHSTNSNGITIIEENDNRRR